MDDEVARHALTAFKYALFAGLALGAFLFSRRSFLWGVGLPALLVGTTAFMGAAAVGWDRHQSTAGMTPVEGRLLHYVTERSTNVSGRTTETRAPVVEYTAVDGQVRSLKGLGGSAPGRASGDAVSLRYDPADPAQARVADFQNTWGLVLALGVFGLFPMLIGLFVTRLAWRMKNAVVVFRRGA